MKLHFLGANRQVTGSCYCLETCTSRIIIDCGMFQERQYQARNWQPFAVPPDSLDALVLTHAHIDHCGLIPRLVRAGFRAPIWTSSATADLLPVMLLDAAKIQVEDAAYKKKRHKKKGHQGRYPEEPLYDTRDVELALPLIRRATYNEPISITNDISVTLHDAGHILGSAMLEVLVREDGAARRIVFSGDIGQPHKPLIRDPSVFTQADYLVMESTYGDRCHEDAGDIQSQLAKTIQAAASSRGNVVIPTFAVERAQELMYFISRLVHDGAVPMIQVFLDSPMAVDVTEIFRQHQDCLDEETRQLISSGEPPLHFPGLRMTQFCLSDIRRKARSGGRFSTVSRKCGFMARFGLCEHASHRFMGFRGTRIAGDFSPGSATFRPHRSSCF